jgi:WD40 repeat protein
LEKANQSGFFVFASTSRSHLARLTGQKSEKVILSRGGATWHNRDYSTQRTRRKDAKVKGMSDLSSTKKPSRPERAVRPMAEALCSEQGQQWQRGERVLVEAYLAQHPELQSNIEALLDLIYNEVLLREQTGEAAQLDEYVRRFPHLAGPLKDLFAVHRAVEGRSLFPVTEVGVAKEASTDQRPMPADGELWPPIPGYEIVGVLGRGGMGIVYQARQVALGRLVALKMVRAGGGAKTHELARFRTEAEAVARLQHPNIVQIYEIGEWAGQPYLSLEYVDGGTLAKKLAGTPQPMRESAALMETVARAVNFAHQHGIVHRDLKPANILLASGVASAPRGTPGANATGLANANATGLAEVVPKITDFGLAKCLDSSVGQTVTGEILGTPTYMAPEQAQGHTKDIGPATDVYALGAILYEMLTGRPPFTAATAWELVAQVRTQEPVSLRRLQAQIPLDLDTICLKCLEKDSRRRYSSALELAEELARFRENRPIRARPVGALGRLARWGRRNPGWAAASSLAAVALVAALILSLVFGVYQARSAAQLQDALDDAQANNRKALRLSATLALDRGQALCEQGEVGAGMLWLARSLDIATQAGADDLQTVIRSNLAGWRQHLYALRGRLEHPTLVFAVALSPDGRTALTGCLDNRARLWDVATGQPIGQPLLHPDGVTCVAFAPDGRTFVTVCADCKARLWNLDTRQPVGPPLADSNYIDAVVFSPDGKTLATASRSRRAQLWDMATGKQIGAPLVHEYHVTAVAFSPNGKTLLTGGRGIQTQLWDVSTRKLVFPPFPPQGSVDAVAFSPDGKTMVTGGEDEAVHFWEAATGKPFREPLRHPDRVKAITFSPDGKVLLTGCYDKTARFWDVATRLPLGAPLQHYGGVRSVAYHPKGRTVLTGSEDGTARLWDAPAENITGLRLPHPASVAGVAYSADGQTMATGCIDGAVRLWQVKKAHMLGPPLRHQDRVDAVAFSPDGRIVATGSYDHTARLWIAASGKPFTKPIQHQDLVMALAFSPDGRALLTGCYDKTARLWEVTSGKPLTPPLIHQGPVKGVAFSPDGRTLVTASTDHTVQLWDAATGKRLGPPLQHPTIVSSVAVGPDGRTILTGSFDHLARLWDAATGKQLGRSFSHRRAVEAVAFSPDGRTVLTGSDDKTARLWDVATGKPLGPPLLHQNYVYAVAFSPDGRSVLTGSEDKTARLWDVPVPVEGEVQQLVRWVEVLTATELDDSGVVHVLDAATWAERRRELERLGGPALP